MGWYRAARHALDRPLTSYYLLLGASALLLTIGLIMVLSACSVLLLRRHDGDSYAVVQRQLVWVLIGLPARGSRSRLPHRWLRRLAYPALSSRSCCCCSPRSSASSVNGNQNWLAVGPLRDPARPRSPSSRW